MQVNIEVPKEEQQERAVKANADIQTLWTKTPTEIDDWVDARYAEGGPGIRRMFKLIFVAIIFILRKIGG